MSLGSSDNLVWNNQMMIHGPDSKYVVYMYQGSDIPDASDGRPRNNHIFDNTLISDDEVAKMLNADDNVIEVRRGGRNGAESRHELVGRRDKCSSSIGHGNGTHGLTQHYAGAFTVSC